MKNFLKISEASSLALHAMTIIAKNPDRLVTTGEMASALKASNNHLSKVLQRLTRSGLLKSVRGPNGGFRLKEKPEKITLLNIYEAIEGVIIPKQCLLDTRVCKGKECVLGGLVASVAKQMKTYLSKTTLKQIAKIKLK